MFAKMWDPNKTREENQTEFEKARHNKEVTQHYVSVVTLVAGVCGIVMTVKKLRDATK